MHGRDSVMGDGLRMGINGGTRISMRCVLFPPIHSLIGWYRLYVATQVSTKGKRPTRDWLLHDKLASRLHM